MKNKLDPEIKMELLIKLAFGIPIQQLVDEYNLTREKIVNLRKNNYVKYNEFFNYWRIDPEVAKLCLPSISERALSVIKKFYTKDKVKIVSVDEIYIKGKLCSLTDIMNIADEILAKDNICNFSKMSGFIKNFY